MFSNTNNETRKNRTGVYNVPLILEMPGIQVQRSTAGVYKVLINSKVTNNLSSKTDTQYGSVTVSLN